MRAIFYTTKINTARHRDYTTRIYALGYFKQESCVIV